jgi:hypothetical protein
MPTGYTDKVAEGKIDSFEDFAKECARAFLYQARDSDEKNLRKLVSNDSVYYQNRLDEAKEHLNKLIGMTEAEWRAYYEKTMDDDEKQREEWNDEKRLKRKRYELMMEKVYAWTPPSSKHEEMKKFMLDQLCISIDCDCKIYEPEARPDYDVWCERHMGYALDEVKHCIERIREEKNRIDRNTEWVEQLLVSIEGR